MSDPFDILETLAVESPVLYEIRLELLRAWYAQRAAMDNVEGLALASVELHGHQLDVVRRVGADPVKRYLLADEVGLGKTIEACALIWQYLKEHPKGRVLVLAPDHLREQWQRELLGRFRTDHYTKAWIRIFAHTAEDRWPDEPVGLLVIDEAHHVTRTGTLDTSARQRIAELAASAGSLLLLSATPVRTNEAGFLDLLCLLDPDHYQPDQVDEFTRRVELRDQLAYTYQALVPDIDAFDLSLYANELRRYFPDDGLLEELLSAAVTADDATRAASVDRVREHLSETYRLHHRLLRTRRTSELGATFAVRGRERAIPFTLEVGDPTDTLRRELLDSLRFHLTAGMEGGALREEDAVAVLREVAQRCTSLPNALLPLLKDSEVEHDGPSLRLFRRLVAGGVLPGWPDLIADILQRGDSQLADLGVALSDIAVSHGSRKTIIASAFTETAAAAAAEMTRRWGTGRVATHLTGQPRAENMAQLKRWESDGPCTILVCDAGTEEGINLQNAELLVHLDLPWQSLRVEQRIGRCDRHVERRAGPIPSVVVAYGDEPYARAWAEYLADGCQIFDRSVSSLQYVLADTEARLLASVLHNGPEALIDAVSGQAAALDTELATIVAQDSLDSIQRPAWAGDATANEALLSSDAQPTLAKALVSWLEGVGASIERLGPGVVRINHKRRLQIPFELEVQVAACMGTPLARTRSAAVKKLIPVLRAGHPLVDAVAVHLRSTDRGVAFAMLRHQRGQWPPVVVLRTDFLVTPVIDDRYLVEARSLGVGDWARQVLEEVLPPVVETVLTTLDGKEVPVPSLLHYNKSVDQNLASRPEAFEQVSSHLDWASVCSTGLACAEAVLARRPSLTARPAQAAATLSGWIRHRVDLGRARRLASAADADDDFDRLLEAVPAALAVDTTPLGCGAIFVADQTMVS